MNTEYDAFLLVSFGGPECMEDVRPFLDNVLRGKRVPPARKEEVAHHYELFGGVSPLNGQNRALLAAVEDELRRHGIGLPLYWGNRNWAPTIPDALRQMAEDGVRRALAFFTSAYSSYSGCRQYRENIVEARAAVGPSAPEVHKLRAFYDHPGFIEANVDAVRAAYAKLPEDLRGDAPLLFTAHSIPVAMAHGCSYEQQLKETARLVAEGVGVSDYRLVYQSRSGPPRQPWLEPDVCEVLPGLRTEGHRAVVLSPIGFTSDHLEVLYDLDTEAAEVCEGLGLSMARAATAGNHPAVAAMVRELVQERLEPARERRALGALGLSPDVCPKDCCLPPAV